MSATYIHTQRKPGFSLIVIRLLAILYFASLAASVVYLWLFTKERFISKADFKISQQATTGVTSGLAQIALPGLSDTGSADSQIVIGYINSSDTLLELEKEFKLQEHYKSPKSDFVFRMKQDANLEERLVYYRQRIVSHYNTETCLTELTVDTFEPKLSQKIAASLLKKSEGYVNRVNQEIADQQLVFVRGEVERTATRVEELNKELLTLQNEYNFISPESQITGNLQAIQEFKLDLLRTEAELATITRDSPNSPRIESLKSHIRSVNELIDTESAKLSGPDKDRLNHQLMEFKQLELKIAFALSLRTSAETLLEKNRVDAASLSKFFTVIQNPYLPEDVAVPQRPYATFIIIALGTMLFLILRVLVRSIFDRA